MGSTRGDGTQHGHTPRREVERADQRGGADQGHQRGGDAAVDPVTDRHEGQDAEADAERPAVDLAQMRQDVPDPVLVAPRCPRQPEELGELVDHDDHGDAGQESRHDGGREELGHPPEPQDAHQDHDEADHDREDGHEVDVALRARRREAGDPGGEQGGDGGVGPDRELRIRAQECEEHGPGHEGVEAGDRRHAGQARRGQLLGHRDDEQGHAGHGVRAGPGAPVAVQRRQHGRAPHGAIFVHGGFPVADRRNDPNDPMPPDDAPHRDE